ncbi:MAG: hypothetical protein PVJ39_00645 [Gammaproteobacteria bacterium]|jgi:hypothetical protein
MTTPPHIRYSVCYAAPVWVALVLMASCVISSCFATEATERRVKISLPLFPRIVAVDANFHAKLTADNRVRLVFIYDRNKSRATELAAIVKENNSNIVNIKVESVPLPLEEQLKDTAVTPTAIFVAEPLGEADFKELVGYGINKGIIVFSPYSGDVERGATVGLAITSRVFPYFNNNTLKASGIKINPLLLEMSKHYE